MSTRAGPPTLLQRLRATAAAVPGRLAEFAGVDAGLSTDEDAFAGGEDGGWAWYPASGSFRPRPLTLRWRLGGPGAWALGSVTRSEGRIRFAPPRTGVVARSPTGSARW